MTNDLFRELLDGNIPGPLVYSAEESQAMLNLFKNAGVRTTSDALRSAPETPYRGQTVNAAWFDEIHPRSQALAAKAARGHGPPSPIGWRGRERTTKFRSQS